MDLAKEISKQTTNSVSCYLLPHITQYFKKKMSPKNEQSNLKNKEVYLWLQGIGLAGTHGLRRGRGRIPSKAREQDFALSSNEYGFAWLTMQIMRG